jgi:solute carrier family 13 (sodium-dependent dicarboxylate transporter), member 2/3/5
MHTLQVAFFFVISYLLSRVFVVLKIPELILYYLLEQKHLTIQKLSFILILGSAVISTFIANVITVLTLLPLVHLLQKETEGIGKEGKKTNTLFLLSVVWGANIGGMGMVTGTTTNGILMGFYEGYKISVGKDFTFLSWMGWGMPLIFLMSCVGWIILMAVFQPNKMVRMNELGAKLESVKMSRQMQIRGFVLAGLFLISSSILSFGLNIFHEQSLWVIIATGICMLGFIYVTLIHKWKTEDGNRKLMLSLRETMHDIPKRGLLWVGIGIVITGLFWYFQLHQHAGLLLKKLFDVQSSSVLLYISLALVAVFASEIVSNTGVHIVMFMVLFPLVKNHPGFSWQGMLIITLSSTCAFMSPIGTPSNGLGFGSSAKISIRHLLGAGFLMNIASAIVISIWVQTAVPLANRFLLR